MSLGKAVLFLNSEGLMILAGAPVCPKAKKIIHPPRHWGEGEKLQSCQSEQKIFDAKQERCENSRTFLGTASRCVSASKADAPLLCMLLWGISVQLVTRSWGYKTVASCSALGNAGLAARAASHVLQAWKNGQLSLFVLAAQGWLQ